MPESTPTHRRSDAIRAALVAHVTNDLDAIHKSTPHHSQPGADSATPLVREPRRRSWHPGWALTVAVVMVAAVAGAAVSTAMLAPRDTAAPPSPDRSLSSSLATDGDAAAWWLIDPQEVSEESTILDIGVTRVGCAGGVTGDVLTPQVTYEPDRILIEVDVAALPDGVYSCPGNDVVPAVVTLSEAVGERILVDAACLADAMSTTAYCLTAERWPDTERDGDMISCVDLLDDIRLLLVGPITNSGYESSCDDATRQVEITVQPGMREQAAELLRQYGPLVVVDEFPYPMGRVEDGRR